LKTDFSKAEFTRKKLFVKSILQAGKLAFSKNVIYGITLNLKAGNES